MRSLGWSSPLPVDLVLINNEESYCRLGLTNNEDIIEGRFKENNCGSSDPKLIQFKINDLNKK